MNLIEGYEALWIWREWFKKEPPKCYFFGSLVCLENKYNALDVVYWNSGIDSMSGDALILTMYKHTGINNLKGKKSKEPHYGKITRRSNGLLMCSLRPS